ncbi:hypothetical protein PS15p_210530 [Mucor circinelloides]
MEESIKTYGRASNSKINYDKSITFPLHGGKMEGYFSTRLRFYIQQKIKKFNYSSPEHIKYLGMKSMDTNISPQEQWEMTKTATKRVIKNFRVKHVHWRRLSINYLERKQNRLLRSKPLKATLRILLPRTDFMLQILQQELVDISALKAGDRWREKGERSSAGGVLGDPGSNHMATTDDSATDELGASGDTGDSGSARDSGESGGSCSDGGSDGSSGGDGGSDASDEEVAFASASRDLGSSDEPNAGIVHP